MNIVASLITILQSLLHPDILPFWQQLGSFLFPQPRGLYEVLEYESKLEILDAKAAKAIFHKRQKVRFLQDSVAAILDQAWGEGEIFADYQCSPGVPVDRFQEGDRFRVLISLREIKNRGDVEEFFVKRTIKNGFPHAVENFQNRVSHKFQYLSIGVVFPKKRHPKRVVLVRENAARVIPLNDDDFQILPDGRFQVTWKTKNPSIHEVFTIRWEW